MKFFKKRNILDFVLGSEHRTAPSAVVGVPPQSQAEPRPASPSIPEDISFSKKVTVRHAPALDMPLPLEETWFYLASGRPLASLRELYEALASMGDDIWRHHVTVEKNDFANWVGTVFQSEELAEQIRGATNQWALRTILSRYL